MDGKRKAPAVRFSGFTGDWEQRKVSDVSEICAGGTPSTAIERYWFPKEIPWLSSGEVHKKRITFTDNKISKEGMDNSSARIVPENSVLIALAGQGKTRGTVAINRIPLTTNQSIAAMTFTKEIVPEFVFCNLENRYDEIRKMSSGVGSRGGLNKQIVGDIEIPYTSKEEQMAIGNYFERLDNLITLHQRKYDALVNTKKSMLQKMFPQNGETVPEIRFSGFTGDWERRKFGDLCENITVGIANSATHAYCDKGVVMFRNQNIKENMLDDSDIIYIDKEFEEKYKNKRLKENDLLVARTGYPGTACVVPKKYENTQTFTTLIARPKNCLNSFFASQYMNSDIGKSYFSSTQIGGGQKNSGAGILENLPMMLPPTLVEQIKIADYCSNLDNLITLQQHKLEKLKQLKQSMLEKMFV